MTEIEAEVHASQHQASRSQDLKRIEQHGEGLRDFGRPLGSSTLPFWSTGGSRLLFDALTLCFLGFDATSCGWSSPDLSPFSKRLKASSRLIDLWLVSPSSSSPSGSSANNRRLFHQQTCSPVFGGPRRCRPVAIEEWFLILSRY